MILISTKSDKAAARPNKDIAVAGLTSNLPVHVYMLQFSKLTTFFLNILFDIQIKFWFRLSQEYDTIRQRHEKERTH